MPKNENEFKVTWKVDDGFINNGPHSFTIRDSDLDTDMTNGELADLFWDMVQNDFESRAHAVSSDEEEFISWAQRKDCKVK